MTWTYSLTNISGSVKDQVRLLIGDTLTTDQQLQDEEIVFAISQRTTAYGAAAECCRTLATQYSRSVTQKAGDTATNYSDLSKAYALRALQFEAKAAAGGAGLPYSGGISVTDKQNNEDDPDRVDPQFSIGMFDSDLPIGQLSVEAPGTDSGNDSS